MDGKAEREALLRYLGMSAQNQVGDPNDGNNYGYSSSMPLSQTPRSDAMIGMAQQLGGIGALASAPFQGFAAPISGLAGAYMVADGARRRRRSDEQLSGTHPDQAQMDAYVNAMRYYGHKPMGPR